MRQLCLFKPSDWWETGDDGNRLALALCGRCPARAATCPGGDPRPYGVIRAGIAYSDTGSPLPVCGCGYPADDRRATEASRCRRCAPPRLDRWKGDVIRWYRRGDSAAVCARRLGFDRTTVRDALTGWGERPPTPSRRDRARPARQPIRALEAVAA